MDHILRRDAMTDTASAVPTISAATAVESYFTTWNESDPVLRRAAIETGWTPDASFVDPLVAAEGADALDALAVAVQQKFPGHRFRQTGAVDVHHDRARWAWELVGPDGVPIGGGVDFAVLAEDGRLRSVTGFFNFEAPA
jgi:hypothetical protein